uniref:LCCL domain-containing protein n=1 Tax=Piliocolobus tephrosceles TaxID=591936 RepID=A0A8C9M1C8_9PRIM
MLCAKRILKLLFLFFLKAESKEWCKAKFEYGMPDYAECLSDGGDNITKYMIETIPIVSKGVNLYSNVSIVLSNKYGMKTKEIVISNKTEGPLNKIFSMRTDIGYPEFVHVKLNSPNTKWRCKKIIIWKDYKYWIFDCVGALNDNVSEATYFLSGNKLYTAYVKTGNDIEAGTTGTIEIILLGKNKRSNTKILHEGFTSGKLTKIVFQASDVGPLEDIILSNEITNDPWYCDFVKIKSDNKMYLFNVKSWLGSPYEKNIKINIKSNSVDESVKDIDCHVRGNDLIDTNNLPNLLENKIQIFKIRCPQNCQNTEFGSIEGSGVHPSSTSICASAIYDGTLSPSGGELIVTVGNDIKNYYVYEEKYNELKTIEFNTKADETNFLFYTYQLDSIDNIKSNVRIVDTFGKLSSLGRLEIRINNKWGSICKKGMNFTFSDDSAKRACKDLGFPSGIIIKENCGDINGQNYCAGHKYPFNGAGILCSGNEQSLFQCNMDSASNCIDHHDDVIIQCLQYSSSEVNKDGSIRLVDVTGSPSTNGIGRLQIYHNNVFGSICSEGWIKENEIIACKELGYNGIKQGGLSHKVCNNILGDNLCGPDTEHINAVNLTCTGNETSLKKCKYETHDDIYCSHDEDVVIGCAGSDGDASGFDNTTTGMTKNLLKLEKKPIHPKIELTCTDKILSKADLVNANVGSIFIVSCPENCDEDIGTVKGTFLYTYDSNICKAAIHTGALHNNVADDIVIIISHKMNKFIGTKRNNIESHTFNGISKTFAISIPTLYLLKEERKSNPKTQDELEESKNLKKESEFSYSNIFNKKNQTAVNTSMYVQPTFQWIAPLGFTGFNGEEKDYINCTNLPNEKYIKNLSNFTFIIYFTLSGGDYKWRTLLSHSLCEGISISIDEDNELIIEQNCNPNIIKSKFKPQIGIPYHIAVVFNKPSKIISLYINSKKAVLEKGKYNFTLNGDLIIGRSNDTSTDYFIGNIHLVEVYKFILSEEEIKESFNSAISLEYVDINNKGMGSFSSSHTTTGNNTINKNSKSNKKNIRKTVDGRECITSCKSKSVLNKNLLINTEEINLKCEHDLLSHHFNGKIGSEFLVRCVDNCIKSKYIIKGENNLYTPDSSICKAAIHAGVYIPNKQPGAQTNNDTFIIKIVQGLIEYKSARGHFG